MFDPMKEQQKLFETWNEGMKKFMNPNFEEMQKNMFPGMGNVQNMYTEMQEKTKKAYEDMQENAKKAYDEMQGNAKKIYDEMQENAKKLYGNVPNYEEYMKKFEEMMPKMEDFTNVENFTNMDNMKAMYTEMQEKTKKAYEDMQENAKKAYEDMQENAKKMYDEMQENAKKMYANVPGYEEYMAKFEEMMPKMDMFKNFEMPNMDMFKNFEMPKMENFANLENMKAMYAEMQENAKKLYANVPGYEEYMKKYTEMFPMMDDYSKLFEVKVPGLEMYNQLSELYNGSVKAEDFMKHMQENSNKMMASFIQNAIPNEKVAELFQQPQQLMETCVKLYQNMMQPWMQIDETLVEKVMKGDLDASLDFFNQISEKYDATFGKVVKMMNMGINMEVAEEQQKALDAYIQMMFAAGKLAAIMSKSNNDSSKTLVEKYQHMVEEGQKVSTFKEFYELWYGINEKAMEDLFATATFSKAFAEFTDKYFKYVAANNVVLERQLSKLPIPTNKDMNSLYLTVYNLRKDMRDVKRELEAVKSAKATAPKAE